jgi:TusA-related sulfurtransferase
MLARTARANKGQHVLVLCDDDAFPMDVRAWCNNTHAELLSIDKSDGVHQAELRLPGATAKATSAASATPGATKNGNGNGNGGNHPAGPTTPLPQIEEEIAATAQPEVVDCRGKRCPAPVMMVAKAARQVRAGDELTILADDEAFALDLKAWCRASGNELLSLDSKGDASEAKVRIVREPAAAKKHPTAPAAPVEAAAAPAKTSDIVDCRGMRCPAPIVSVSRAAKQARKGDLMIVLSDDDAFPRDIEAWCRATGNGLQSVDKNAEDNAYRAEILIGGAGVAPRETQAPASPPPSPRQMMPTPRAQPAPSIPPQVSADGVVEVECNGKDCLSPIMADGAAPRKADSHSGHRSEVPARPAQLVQRNARHDRAPLG